MKIAQRIWDQKYVGMDELLPSKLGAEPSFADLLSNSIKNKPPKRIETVEQWVCSFNTYVAVMAMKRPERVPDLLAYSTLIVNASRAYEGTPWIDYDVHFRRQKAADQSNPGDFAKVDSSIWTMRFGGAKAKAICRDCCEPGHSSCKSEDQHQRWEQRESLRSRTQPYRKPPSRVGSTPNDVCWLFNSSEGCDGKRWGRPCHFRHLCARCGQEGHPVSRCPRAKLRVPSSSGATRP